MRFAEKKILAALPKMAKAAQSEELRSAFEKHHGETETQIERLERVFAIIEMKPPACLSQAEDVILCISSIVDNLSIHTVNLENPALPEASTPSRRRRG